MVKNTDTCNVCSGMHNEMVKQGVFGNPAQNIYRCHDCGHVFLAPLLSDQEEEQFYMNEYPVFLLKRGDTKNSSPEEHFKKNKDEAGRRYRDIAPLLGKTKDTLEIGSASGFFLDHLRPYVGDVCGVEPHAAFAAFANARTISTFPDTHDIQGKKFDLIFLYYVLEHVKAPVAFISGLIPFLRDTHAKIIVEVPNVEEALVSLYKCRAYGDFVWQRAHCSYFSVKVLRALFSKCGLKVRFIPVQRYDVSNHLYWLAEGKPGGMEKYSHIFPSTLNESYKESLKQSWLCDSILAIVSRD